MHIEHALEKQVLMCTWGKTGGHLTIEWPTSSIWEFGSRCPPMVTNVGDGMCLRWCSCPLLSSGQEKKHYSCHGRCTHLTKCDTCNNHMSKRKGTSEFLKNKGHVYHIHFILLKIRSNQGTINQHKVSIRSKVRSIQQGASIIHSK